MLQLLDSRLYSAEQIAAYWEKKQTQSTAQVASPQKKSALEELIEEEDFEMDDFEMPSMNRSKSVNFEAAEKKDESLN